MFSLPTIDYKSFANCATMACLPILDCNCSDGTTTLLSDDDVFPGHGMHSPMPLDGLDIESPSIPLQESLSLHSMYYQSLAPSLTEVPVV